MYISKTLLCKLVNQYMSRAFIALCHGSYVMCSSVSWLQDDKSEDTLKNAIRCILLNLSIRMPMMLRLFVDVGGGGPRSLFGCSRQRSWDLGFVPAEFFLQENVKGYQKIGCKSSPATKQGESN